MLEVIDLSRRYGDVIALDHLSFTVEPGQLFGFVGPNGAGKTTTMRIILGVLEPDGGEVRWRDRPVDLETRARFGYMPEERGLYPRMPVLEQLVFFASLYGIARDPAARAAREWLHRFRISDVAERTAESLSKGNQQKVQFIATVLHDPDVLVMDEPFTGLDPVNAALLRAAFLELRDRGKTLIFSTHQLDTAEALCESVAIIDHGRVVTGGRTRDVRRSTGHQVVRLATASDGDGSWLTRVPDVTITRPGEDFTELRVRAGADPQALLRAALDTGQQVLRFEVADPSLEEVFVQRVGALDTEEQTLAAAGGVR